MKKECLHKFAFFQLGTELITECSKCGEDVYDVYEREDANQIINNLFNEIKNENRGNKRRRLFSR